MVRGIHMHNMFLSGTDFWGSRWIRRTTPFREAWVLTPLMPCPCMHGLTRPIGLWEARGEYGSVYNAGYEATNREVTPRHGAHWLPTCVAKLHFPRGGPEYAYAARRIVTTGRATLFDWGSTAAGKPGK
jgi:hypothetical protein